MISFKQIASLALLSLPTLATATPTSPGRSYTPIIGYDDKNGAIYGAAAFLYQDGRPGYNAGLYGVSNGGSFHALTFNWERRQDSGLDLSLKSQLARSFDQYYGEGSATPNAPLLRMDQDRAELQASALLQLDGHWSAGPSASLKARRETAMKAPDGAMIAGGRGFADAASPALGLKLQYDDRDSQLSSTRGGLLAMELRAIPAQLSLGDGANDAWQAEAEWRHFHSLGGGVVLASKASGGASLGEPGYMDRFALGGTEALRGFQDNRFRGSRYYCLQQELRAPIYKMVSAAVSVDLGEAGDGRLTRPRKSAQAGLRVGLPPSYGMQARLDTGYGDSGERSMMLQFGHSF